MPLTGAPSSPRSPRAAQRVTSGPPALLLPPTLPRAKGLLAARALGSETLGHCGLSLPVPLSSLMPAHVSPRRARALVHPGQWQQGQGAGAALGTFLGLQICTLGSSPPRPTGRLSSWETPGRVTASAQAHRDPGDGCCKEQALCPRPRKRPDSRMGQRHLPSSSRSALGRQPRLDKPGLLILTPNEELGRVDKRA